MVAGVPRVLPAGAVAVAAVHGPRAGVAAVAGVPRVLPAGVVAVAAVHAPRWRLRHRARFRRALWRGARFRCALCWASVELRQAPAARPASRVDVPEVAAGPPVARRRSRLGRTCNLPRGAASPDAALPAGLARGPARFGWPCNRWRSGRCTLGGACPECLAERRGARLGRVLAQSAPGLAPRAARPAGGAASGGPLAPGARPGASGAARRSTACPGGAAPTPGAFRGAVPAGAAFPPRAPAARHWLEAWAA